MQQTEELDLGSHHSCEGLPPLSLVVAAKDEAEVVMASDSLGYVTSKGKGIPWHVEVNPPEGGL